MARSEGWSADRGQAKGLRSTLTYGLVLLMVVVRLLLLEGGLVD